MPRTLTTLVWLLFLGALAAAAAFAGGEPVAAGPLRLDALALLLAPAILFVSAIVHSFARRYMDGDARIDGFFVRLTALTLTVLVLLAADHMVLFAAAWTVMGLLLADLVGHVRSWPQARAAAALARTSFLAGSALLAMGLGLVHGATGAATISGALAAVGTADGTLLALACVALAIAAAIQCGLFPFHGWLMSSMTAPTPVSAFMHAGLVNAGGILLARTAPVFEAVPHAMTAVFLLGAVSALSGAAMALVQTDVKRGLAASTVAQMGFMVLQCGLGFHAAAMAHLVLHGLYKACLFLGAGSALSAAGRPDAAKAPLDARSLALALPTALIAGAVFALVTGKLAGPVDTGLILVAFAAIAAAQAGIALRGWRPDGLAALLIAAPLAVALTAALYGFVVSGAEAALATVPGAVDPQALNPVHALVLLAFAGTWVWALGGAGRSGADALYTRLLNAGQPARSTVTDRRGFYRA